MPLPNAVANPIINDPFATPTQHYDFSGEMLKQILIGIQSALVTLASKWRKTLDAWREWAIHAAGAEPGLQRDQQRPK